MNNAEHYIRDFIGRRMTQATDPQVMIGFVSDGSAVATLSQYEGAESYWPGNAEADSDVSYRRIPLAQEGRGDTIEAALADLAAQLRGWEGERA